jgi:CDP-paratose 2-epimerase
MRALITGGCGFIGSNAALGFRRAGFDVILFDNLSRFGSEKNLDWLRTKGAFQFEAGDVRSHSSIETVMRKYRVDVILHLAAQVAVTTSVTNPREDFETNALGTVNVLEAMRQYAPESTLLYASTNKVYGSLRAHEVRETDTRYEFCHLPSGIDEDHNLDFHSPYGCSKGAADQYVLDYSRIYHLNTMSFRQSCIYGPRQFGIEDQGWLAWFAILHAHRRGVTIFGTGKQVRDVLFIDDLVECYLAAVRRAREASGCVFNIGGGAGNTLSLSESLSLLEQISGRPVSRTYAAWRPGDQPIFCSDITRARTILNWEPRTSAAVGLRTLYSWVTDHKNLFTLIPETDNADVEPCAAYF